MYHEARTYEPNLIYNIAFMPPCINYFHIKIVMDRLQTSGELQDKTSFIDPSTGVDLLKSCSPDYLLL
jgi:hypothetical protein